MSVAGKTILVTGATSGIGKEAAIMLARDGANVVIVGRDERKTAAARAEVRRRSGADAVASMLCDFADQGSIRRLATDFRAAHRRLDVLINNAGGVHARRELTADGIEATFAVNHLGYFLLTKLLLDLITASAPARIVNVASRAHYRATLDLDDPGYVRGWSTMRAYARSKLANVMFTRVLARRLEGSGVTVNAVHPGVVGTHIWDRGAPAWASRLFGIAMVPVKHAFMRTPEDGAHVVVRLATDAGLEGRSGLYFDRNHVAEPAPLACDDALAERLWQASENMIR